MSTKTKGLQYDQRTGQWSIDKRIKGYGRVRQRLQASTKEQAELMFRNLINQIQLSMQRPKSNTLTFRDAGIRYVEEHQSKKSIDRDITCLENLDPFIGHLSLQQIHGKNLKPYLEARKELGISSGTIQRELAVVRGILNLAASEWRDDDDQLFLTSVPLLKKPDWDDEKTPYPLESKQQRELFLKLPKYLRPLAYFAVNTGLRDQGVCKLRWDWEKEIPGINATIFVTPGKPRDYDGVRWNGEKNKQDQIVVLNRVARRIIELQRARREPGCPWVFPVDGKPLPKMNCYDWQQAWPAAGLPVCEDTSRGPHNLKHTFGRRLTALGVPKEIRRELMHHKTRDVTDVYTPSDIQTLINSAEKVVRHRSVLILRSE